MTFKPASLALGLAACCIGGSSLAAKDKPDERLSSVSAIFVAGNSPAAEKIRSVIREGKKTCFALATKAVDADAVLEISDNSQLDPSSLVGERQSLVSGNLTLKSGDLIWSGSKRFSDAPFTSGSKVAGELLVRQLARDAQCKSRQKARTDR